MKIFPFFSGKNIVLLSLFVAILFGTFFSEVLANNKETPPSGKVKNGSYVNILKTALENPPDSSSDTLGANNATQQANALANTKGEKILWIVDGKLGIGIQTPQELLDVRSDTKASITVKSKTPSSQLKLSNGIFGILEKKFFLQMETQKIFIENLGINIEGELVIDNNNVVGGDQQCPLGQKISGTDEEGNIICVDFITRQNYCNLNDIDLSQRISVIGSCQIAPTGDEKGCTLDFSGTKYFDNNCNFNSG